MKHRDLGLGVIATGLAIGLLGCGGGGGGIINPNPTPTTSATTTPTTTGTPQPSNTPVGTQQFAGDYTGAFVAIGSLSGADVSGTFDATSNFVGAITGTVKQDSGPTALAQGTINSSGAVTVTANGNVTATGLTNALRPRQSATATPFPTATAIPTTGPIVISYSTKLTGTATISGSDSLLSGTLLTTQSNGNNPRGGFVGIRSATKTSSYLGSYAGTLSATVTSTGAKYTGDLSLSISKNGLARGVYTPDNSNVRSRPLVGTVDSAGNVSLFFLAEEENPVGSDTYTLTVTTLTAKVPTTGSATISGTLSRSGTSAARSTGTFTLRRS